MNDTPAPQNEAMAKKPDKAALEGGKPIAECVNVCKSFHAGGETLSVLRGLNLAIFPKTTNVILGESGCGKSTLLNIIGALEPLTSGAVMAGGRAVHSLDEIEAAEYRRHFIGFVFQFHYLLKDFTALENVVLPGLIGGMKKAAAVERAKGLLARLNLEKRMKHLPSQLSGGERQRVAVARALINRPRLVLADEPTGNLDPFHSESVLDALFSVVTETGSSLLMVTHDRAAARLADRVYTLSGGALREGVL